MSVHPISDEQSARFAAFKPRPGPTRRRLHKTRVCVEFFGWFSLVVIIATITLT